MIMECNTKYENLRERHSVHSISDSQFFSVWFGRSKKKRFSFESEVTPCCSDFGARFSRMRLLTSKY